MISNIPYTPNEMTFSQFLDMKAAEKAYLDDTRNVVIHSVLPYLKNINDAYDLPYGDSTEYRLLMPGEEITATAMYNHLIYVIETYKSKVRTKDVLYKFEHKGETYHVNERGIKALAGMAFAVGEVVEVLQYQTLYSRMEKEFENQKNGQIFDHDCAMEFKLGLQEMAVLCRKKDEKLPILKRERDVFIVERIKEFEDLPMSIVLDIRFFLLSGLSKLAVTQIMPFTLREKSESAETKLKKRQSKPANKRLKKPLG